MCYQGNLEKKRVWKQVAKGTEQQTMELILRETMGVVKVCLKADFPGKKKQEKSPNMFPMRGNI